MTTENLATERLLPPGAHIADPAPLGLAGFAMTTFFLSVINAGLIPVSVEAGVLGLAIFYGGLAQFVAGIWEFTKGNTFGAVAFCSYAAFWASFYFLVDMTDLSAAGADAEKAVAVYLLGWTIFTVIMMVTSFRISGILAGVFIALFITFALLTIGAFSGSDLATKAGGWTGLVTALMAWYAAFAGLYNGTVKKPVIPVWPRG